MDLASERAYPTPYANSPLLPLLLLSLMQQKHAPTTSNTFKTEYDFIIVGAGSAGSVVANRLSEIPCVSVLLLEAGKSPPLLTEVPAILASFALSDISWSYFTVPQKHTGKALVDKKIIWPSGKALGGTSILNGMLYVTGNKYNYNDWAEQGAVGWSYSDVKPYFLKAENNTSPEYLVDGYHAVGGPLNVEKVVYQTEFKKPVLEAALQLGYNIGDPNGRNQTGFYDIQVTTRNGQRFSTAKAYLVPAENRTNLDIVANAFVQKVLIEGHRAVGVQFRYKNRTYDIKAKREVIMSAGAVNSAQLLMISGIGPKEHLKQLKIPVVADLPVGKNLQDHCGTFLYFGLDNRTTSIEERLQNTSNIKDYIKNRRGPLAYTQADLLAFLPGPSNPVLDFPDYQLYIGLAFQQVPSEKFGIKPEIIKKYFGPYENSALFACFAQILNPKSRGTVRLQSSNPYDPPLIDPNYFENPDDFTSIVEGLKTCKKIGTSKQIKEFGAKIFTEPFPGCEETFGDDDKYFECLAKSFVVTLNHQVGTAKMGDPGDPTTVVCPRLKVKGIDGLRVVDASIMPIVPSGNTNVPVIMVAEKASDMIKNTINCYTQIPV